MKTGITLFLDPAAAESGTGKAAPAAKPLVAAPMQAPALSAADLIAQIEADPAAFETTVVPGEDDGGEGGETSNIQTAEQKAKADADAKAKEEKARADARPTPVELNADQKAWLELRAAAKTAEEAAEVDKEAPAFTDEEWALVEAQSVEGREAKAEGQPEITAQLTAAQTEAATAKAELEAKSKRLQEVEAELARAMTQPVAIAPMNPLLMADATQLDQAEAAAHQMKEWALKHWDGTAAVAAQGDQPAQPAYTAEQIRAAYARADKQLSAVIPTARQYLADHMAQNVNAKAVYPEIFDANSPSHQATESILQRLPGLRTALPSIKMVMGDALVGEKIRGLIYADKPSAETLALTAALVKADPTLAKFMPQLSTAGKTPGAKPGMKLPAKPIVPLARPGSAGGRGAMPRPGGASAKPGAPDNKRFQQLKTANGGNELEALAETLRNVNVE